MAQTMGDNSEFDNCLVDLDGNCVIDPTPPPPPPAFSSGMWVGGWFDSSGIYQTVTASTFVGCTLLLDAATQGLMVITSTCRRT